MSIFKHNYVKTDKIELLTTEHYLFQRYITQSLPVTLSLW